MTTQATDNTSSRLPGIAGMAGPAVMLLGMLLFAMNDAMGKWLVANYGLGQVILMFAPWEAIFIWLGIWGAVMLAWTAFRLARRSPLTQEYQGTPQATASA